MGYQIQIAINEQTLMKLEEKTKPVIDERFLYCLQNNTWTIEEVEKFNSAIRISIFYVSSEFERIKMLRKVYNLEYPTDHKKYFSTVATFMSKMRSTLSSYKNLMTDFRKKQRGKKIKRSFHGIDPTALHEGEYSADIFGLESYPDKVQEMFDNINNFLKLANGVFQEAIDVINEEKAIRSDPNLACPIYENSYQQSVKDNKKLIEMLDAGNVNVDHDIVKAMETTVDVRMLIASLFHEISFADFNYFCACKAINDGRKAGLTDEEAAIFGKKNAKKVFRLRVLLDHITELVEQRDDITEWKDKLSGKFMMHLLYWCGWSGSKNDAMLNYISKRCEGKICVVKMGAVMAAKSKLIHYDFSKQSMLQNDFNQQIDEFIDQLLSKQEEEVA